MRDWAGAREVGERARDTSAIFAVGPHSNAMYGDVSTSPDQCSLW